MTFFVLLFNAEVYAAVEKQKAKHEQCITHVNVFLHFIHKQHSWQRIEDGWVQSVGWTPFEWTSARRVEEVQAADYHERFERLTHSPDFNATRLSAAVQLEFLSSSRKHSLYSSALGSYGVWDIHQFLPFTFCLITFLRRWSVIYLMGAKQFLTNLSAFSSRRLTNVQKSPSSSLFTGISYSWCIYSGLLLWNSVLFFFLCERVRVYMCVCV